MRLIDADKLDTRERGNNSQRTMWREIEWLIKNAPTVDAIVLPVKAGQTIYRVGDPIKKIYEWDVAYIEVYEDEIEYVDDSDNRFTADDIVKTVFLTREAAEAALKAGENNAD